MIDTGASNTHLHGPVVLPWQDRLLASTIEASLGIGGDGLYYKESALLVLLDEANRNVYFPIVLRIQSLTAQDILQRPLLLLLPSLLGRDVLKDCDLRVKLSDGTVLLDKLR